MGFSKIATKGGAWERLMELRISVIRFGGFSCFFFLIFSSGICFFLGGDD